MTDPNLEFSGAGLRAVADALSALCFSLARQLNLDQQDGLATDLARLAKDAQASGNAELEELLLDMHRKVRTGSGAVRPIATEAASPAAMALAASHGAGATRTTG